MGLPPSEELVGRAELVLGPRPAACGAPELWGWLVAGLQTHLEGLVKADTRERLTRWKWRMQS
eukprot:7175710-Alexandrium_andersonii.AAC.1